jgi:hypothetical protein
MKTPHNVTAHRLIAETAVTMAQELYEEVCSGDNAMYRTYKNRSEFVKRIAPALKQHAKVVLAKLLTSPSVTEAEKQSIYDALIMDNELPDGTSIARPGWQQ